MVTSGSQPCCDDILLSSMLKYVSALEVAMEAVLNGPEEIEHEYEPTIIDAV